MQKTSKLAGGLKGKLYTADPVNKYKTGGNKRRSICLRAKSFSKVHGRMPINRNFFIFFVSRYESVLFLIWNRNGTMADTIYYCILSEIRNEFFDLTDRTQTYRPAYGPGNALTQ